jgi:hypothetical protein
MQGLLANSSKPWDAYLENQAFEVGLLGGFTDTAVDGHRESSSEVGV